MKNPNPNQSFQVASAQHIGQNQKRKSLEDRCEAFKIRTASGMDLIVGLVADGIGGASSGEVAGEKTLEIVKSHLKQSRDTSVNKMLSEAILLAHKAVLKEGKENPRYRSMGTTVVIAAIHQNKAYIANVGDSRAYLIRGKDVFQLTIDQTWGNEKLREGKLSFKESLTHPRSNHLGRYIGQPDPLSAETGYVPLGENDPDPSKITMELGGLNLNQGDAILLCSDGLIKERAGRPSEHYVEIHEISQVIKQNDPQDAANTLVSLASGRQVDDNVSVVILEAPGKKKAFAIPAQLQSANMKTALAAGGILGLLVLIGLFGYRFMSRSEVPQPQVTEIVPTRFVQTGQIFVYQVDGEAFFSEPGGSSTQIFAGGSIPAVSGLKITTGANSRYLQAILPDGSQIYLASDTEINFLSFAELNQQLNAKNTLIAINKGRILISVNLLPGFTSKIVEPIQNISAEVIGSVMGVEFINDSIAFAIDCIEGVCKATIPDSEPVALTENQRIPIEAGRPGEIEEAQCGIWLELLGPISLLQNCEIQNTPYSLRFDHQGSGGTIARYFGFSKLVVVGLAMIGFFLIIGALDKVSGKMLKGLISLCIKFDWLAVFALMFGVYIFTLAPTVTGLDSAELITGAYTLGVVHPTGYPLYMLLGKLFTFLPFSDIAYRLNLMSAFFGALTICFLYLTLRRNNINRIISFSISVLLSLSLAFWQLSVVAEVYTLNTFLMILALYAVSVWTAENKGMFLYLATFAVGLALANHVSILFFVPGGLYLIMARGKGYWSVKQVISHLVIFILPLSLYAYFPLRLDQQLALNYMNYYPMVDLKTIQGLLWLITGQAYRFFAWGYTSFPEVIKEFVSFGDGLYRNLGLPLIVLGLIGFVHGLKIKPRLSLASLMMFGLHTIFYINYRVVDKATMFLPSYIIWALWSAFGASYIYDKFVNREVELFKQTHRLALGSVMISAVLLISLLVTNLPLTDKSEDFSYQSLAARIFSEIEHGSVVVADWNTAVVLEYYQKIYGVRPDLEIVNSSRFEVATYYSLWSVNSTLPTNKILGMVSERERRYLEKFVDEPIYLLTVSGGNVAYEIYEVTSK